MADFPALPLWTDAYLADTTHLSATESGAYLHLLMAAWRTQGCCLPNDDRQLARMARCSTKEWKRVRAVVMAFWVIDESASTVSQKRLTSERIRVLEKSQDQSRKAHLKWLKQRQTRNAVAYAEPMPDGCQDVCQTDASISISISREERTIGQNAKSDTEQAFEQFWSAYPRKTAKGSARGAFRKALTKSTLPSILAALERQKPQWSDPNFIPHPATWLNAERWLDETANVVPISKRPEDIQAGRLETYRKSGYWGSDWGPCPTSEGVAAQ